MNIKNIRHFGILVDNLEFALHFYKDLLGLQEIKRETLEGDYIENLLNTKSIKMTYVKLKLKGMKTLIELWYLHNFKLPHQKMSHIAFTVNNLDELIVRLRDSGIKFLSLPIKNNKVKVCFCYDYSDNLIELVEPQKKIKPIQSSIEEKPQALKLE